MNALISTEALAVLAETPIPDKDRSQGSLPELRKETRAYYTPAIERVLKRTGIIVQTSTISGIPCLEVLPSVLRVDWPILYGFGGGFVMGSPFEDLTMTAPLAAATSARVIVPDYRLAPEHPWPAAIEDGFEVYQALAGKPFALSGESAGGNLALTLMLRAQGQGLRLPSAVALLSPWCDLTNMGDSLSANEGRDPTLTYRDVDTAAKHYAGNNTRTHADISPINGKFAAHFPPVMITTGTRDLLASQAVRLATVLRHAGIYTDLRVWEGLWHVFECDDRLPEAAQSLNQIADFLLKNMGTAVPAGH